MTHYDEMVDTVVALLRTPRGEGEIAAVLDAVEAEADKWDDGIVPSFASRETVREIRRRLAVLRSEAQGEAETLAAEILAELRRAREKFRGYNVTALAMVEEVGELAKALIDESRERVRQEAIQVAAMAMRVVLDGDQTLDAWRESKGLDPLTAARRGEAPVGELDQLRELLRDVAASGVVLDDARLRYVEIQVDRQTWDEVCALTARTNGGGERK